MMNRIHRPVQISRLWPTGRTGRQTANEQRGGNTMLLGDKVAVISGAASPRGIGLATARLFAQHGASVAIFDIDEAGARRAAAELGPQHQGFGCDVTDLA